MLVIAKPEKKGHRTMGPNTHHFNYVHKSGNGEQKVSYSIGAEPVEVPDEDAKAMLAQGKVMVYETEPSGETEKARPGRRSKSG